MNIAKREVEALLAKLPDDTTLEDVQYHLYVLEKAQRGVKATEEPGAVPQAEAEARPAKWRSSFPSFTASVS